MPIAVFALAVGAFAISTTEFVILGLLLNVSQDFSISISDAGMLITAYAVGVVIGAPLLTPVLAGFPRKNVIIFLLGLFIAGNLMGAFAPSYEILLLSRVLTALVHASFYGITSIVAAQLVTSDKQARAMSMVFMGATISNVAGAPLGTFLGQVYGWRSTSFACAALGALAAVIIFWVVPKVHSEKPKNIASEFRALLQPKVIRALTLTLIGFGGTFTLLTYIAPVLTQLSGYQEQDMSFLLLLLGLGMAVGNPIGGWLTDKNLNIGLRSTLTFLFVTLVSIGFLSTYTHAMAFMMFVLGAAMFATITPLQVHAMKSADSAPLMGASFNIAAFNLANAIAAVIGGKVIESSLGISNLAFVAGAITLVGIIMSLFFQLSSDKLINERNTSIA